VLDPTLTRRAVTDEMDPRGLVLSTVKLDSVAMQAPLPTTSTAIKADDVSKQKM